MSKQKTHKGASKRFKITKTGKVLSLSHMGRHRRKAASASAKRRHQEPAEITGLIGKKIRRMLAVE